jgi:hypothetical protein
MISLYLPFISDLVKLSAAFVELIPDEILKRGYQVFQTRLIKPRTSDAYEVLEHHITLELLDVKGQLARYQKEQKVRFLLDNIIAFQDQAWGDGDVFIDYECSPGVLVDRYDEGNRHRLLISLRDTKHRNDIETFHIQRTIKRGYTSPNGYLQTNIDHKTHKASLSVIFPRKRPPSQISFLEKKKVKTRVLGLENRTLLPDGRIKYAVTMECPAQFEAYLIQWSW